MAKLQKKWIASDAVDGSKFKLLNEQWFRGRDSADLADVNMFKLNSSDAIEFDLIPQMPTTTPTLDGQIASKKYVDDQFAAVGQALSWKNSVKDFVTDNTVIPVTEVTGDRYVLSTSGGAPHADWDGAQPGDIVQFDGSVWVAETPSTADAFIAEDELTSVYLFNGSVWVAKGFESTVGGSGTTLNGNAIDVNVDNASIEINGSDQLQVKANSLTTGYMDLSSVNAVGLSTTGTYNSSTASGNVTGGDTIQAALEKIEKKADNAGGAAPVQSVNSLTGTVVLDAEDLLVDSTYDSSSASGNVSTSDTINTALEKIEKKADTALSSTQAAGNEIITLTGTDITNGYVDLAQIAIANSIQVCPKGGLIQESGVDYTVSTPSNTRITFSGDLASELASGDKLMIQYLY